MAGDIVYTVTKAQTARQPRANLSLPVPETSMQARGATHLREAGSSLETTDRATHYQTGPIARTYTDSEGYITSINLLIKLIHPFV